MTPSDESGQRAAADRVEDRKATEDALQELRELLEATFEHSAFGKVVLDRHGTIVRLNQSICDVLGYDKSELIGLTDNDLAHPEEIGRFDSLFQAVVRGEIPRYAVERRYRRRDGGYVWFSLVISMVRSPQGEPKLVVAELQDLSERHATEAELRRKRAEAEAALIAKSEFLSNMSHELRTPLTGVIGFGGLLQRMDGLPEKARTYISRIVQGGEALLSVVNNILDFTKLESGHVELDPHSVDPRVLVTEALELTRQDARGKPLELLTAFDPALPATIVADGARIRQVLLNLVSNAIKFTAQGEVLVSAKPEADGIVRFLVSDTGIGIPNALSGRLFQRFSQIDGSISREYGGTGLGLAISKGLVELMGGQIGFESQEGVGSTFWFTVASNVAARSDAAQAVVDPEPVSASPLRILVVDDVAMNRELLMDILQQFGADFAEASNGVEAVSAAMASRFDLILMDLQMPGMDGYAATRAIRANCELNREAQIIGVSANVLPQHIEACREAGMDDYLAKPLSIAALRAKVAACAARSAHTE
jgi:PAS domain S-box-containing protein